MCYLLKLWLLQVRVRTARPVGLTSWPFVAAVAAIFPIWAAAIVVWVGPALVWRAVTSTGSIALSSIGSFGDSFGVVTSLFSGAAVALVFLTYRTQRAELDHLRVHLAVEQRRQRITYLVERLERHLHEVTAGNLQGSSLLTWMNDELDSQFAWGVPGEATSSQRWEQILNAHALPDIAPLRPAVFTLLSLARIKEQVADESELSDLADLGRSVVSVDYLVPLLYASAKILQGNAPKLACMANLFSVLDVRPVITKAYDLGQVPGDAPTTLDETLVGHQEL